MRPTSLLTLSATLLIAASCSENDPDGVIDPTNAITFNATSPKASRAGTTTTATLKSFNLYAYAGDKLYMDNVTVSKESGSWSYSPKKYWPSDPVSFFAFSPAVKGYTEPTSTSAPKIANYTVDGSDLLYATNIHEIPKPQPVQINFRHALSKIDIMLSSSNPEITVKVYHVLLCGINSTATFLYPGATTSAEAPNVTGSWTGQSNPLSHMVFYAMAAGDEVTLNTVPTNLSEGNLEWYFMIPQTLSDVTVTDGKYAGQYIAVECVIYDKNTGAKIWPNSQTPPYQQLEESEAGRLVYPVKTATLTDWAPGYNYVYSIDIKSPKELDEIDFDVTVDEYNQNL